MSFRWMPTAVGRQGSLSKGIAARALPSVSSGPRHPNQIAKASSATAPSPATPNTNGRNRGSRKAAAKSPTRSDAGSRPEVCGFSSADAGFGAADDAPCGCDARARSASDASCRSRARCGSVKAAGWVENTSRIPLIPRHP
jgi:hypothetical protein